MNAGKYLLVIVLILFSGLLGGAFMGLLGGAIASKLAQFGIVPKPFREHAVAWKGFEIVDNRGKQRVLLDKYGLKFFDEEGQQSASLGDGTLSLSDNSTRSSIAVNPGGSHAISFSRVRERRPHEVILIPGPMQPNEIPKLGVYRQDGDIVWEVPGEVRCPTLTPKAITLTTVLPLAEQLSPAEKLQLIEHFARELQATAPSFQAQP
ncbi:MAG TPA: hypothetical protein VKJ47_20245 [Candidatus Binatia bacterium]|nr:hypothetical protein [Candidatus Binatia bacterium]